MPDRYKRPQSVLVVVCTQDGSVLLLRRPEPAAFWQSVTGSLRWGETARHAALRELYEETGLRTGGTANLVDLRRGERFPIVPPWRQQYAPSARTNREHWFLLVLRTRRRLRLNPAEHREYRWLSPHQAARCASSWTNRKAIRLLLGV